MLLRPNFQRKVVLCRLIREQFLRNLLNFQSHTSVLEQFIYSFLKVKTTFRVSPSNIESFCSFCFRHLSLVLVSLRDSFPSYLIRVFWNSLQLSLSQIVSFSVLPLLFFLFYVLDNYLIEIFVYKILLFSLLISM